MNRTLRLLSLSVSVVVMAACCTTPTAAPLSGGPPTREQIAASLAQFPTEMRRTFFVTIHAAGHRITATGVFDMHSANDFRLTAVTEVGNILFDVRKDWAGIHITRVMQGMPESVVETIARDVSLALRLPGENGLENLEAKKESTQVKTKFGDGFHFTYTFANPEARLRETEVDVGMFDKLEVTFGRYEGGGPMDLTLHRPLYTLQLTFTDHVTTPSK